MNKVSKMFKSAYLWAVVPGLALPPCGVGGTQAVTQREVAAAELRGVGHTGPRHTVVAWQRRMS